LTDGKGLTRNVLLYGVIGGGSALLDVSLFVLLRSRWNVNEFIANTISTHCGIGASFYFNRKYNFKREDRMWIRAFLFYLTGLFGLLLSNGLLMLGNLLNFPLNEVKLSSVFIVAGAQFAINKWVTFGTRV
jgi:putative flippase GtrA